MPGVSQTVDLNNFASFTNELNANYQGMTFQKAWPAVGFAVSQDFKKNFDNASDPDGNAWAALKHRRPRGGDKPLRDTGLLMASTGARGGTPTVLQTTPYTFRQGTNLDTAAIHQFGGTIRPTKGRALAIPMTVEAMRAGGPRNFGRELTMIWPRGRTTGMLIETNRGRGKKNRGARSVIQFLLVSQVTITARPFIGIGERLTNNVDKILGKYSRDVIAGT